MLLMAACNVQGKRYSLPSSRIMIHQPLGGAQGQAADIEIQANEILHHKLTLNGYLAEFSGQGMERITQDTGGRPCLSCIPFACFNRISCLRHDRCVYLSAEHSYCIPQMHGSQVALHKLTASFDLHLPFAAKSTKYGITRHVSTESAPHGGMTMLASLPASLLQSERASFVTTELTNFMACRPRFLHVSPGGCGLWIDRCSRQQASSFGVPGPEQWRLLVRSSIASYLLCVVSAVILV